MSVEDLLEAAQVSRRTFLTSSRARKMSRSRCTRWAPSSLLEVVPARDLERERSIVQLEKCIDIHLSNARMMGRLVYVLGGEAQSLESPLHPRRMEVHDLLVEMFRAGGEQAQQVDRCLSARSCSRSSR